MQLVDTWPRLADDTPDTTAWLSRLCAPFSASHAACIHAAWSYIHETAIQTQALEMAAILSDLSAGPETLAAALCFPAVTQKILAIDDIQEKHPVIVHILHGAQQMQAMHGRSKANSTAQQEHLRKMLIAMINDVRVALVKLAEQLWILRHIEVLSPPKQHALAQDIQQIYAPLANRLGIGQVKWEMEDRALKILHPEDYQAISAQLNMRRVDREQYLQDVLQQVGTTLASHHIPAEVTGRIKHINSIWRKMQLKGLSFEGLFDIRALRILVRDVRACYRALSTIHTLWPALQHEFADYIAVPKPNGYQSIHTIVVGPEQKTIEIQIRTFTMHEDAEMGVAAHWRYKEGGGQDANMETRIAWLRSLLDWQQEWQGKAPSDNDHVVDSHIYVFTPGGDVVALPAGSTPVDFAYHVHTEVGHRCRGAKVDGKMVTLNTPLHTGQQIDIVTGKESKPSRDWIRESKGYVASHRARQKIQYWFRQLNKTENIHEGKELVLKAIKRAGLKIPDFDVMAPKFNVKTGEDLLAAVATGDARLKLVLDQAKYQQGLLVDALINQPEPEQAPKASQNDLVIQGVDNLLFKLAGCCQPEWGDDVQGYITQGRGVTVHAKTCPTLAKLRHKRPERLVSVRWGKKP